MAYDLGKIPAQVWPHKTYQQYLDDDRKPVAPSFDRYRQDLP